MIYAFFLGIQLAGDGAGDRFGAALIGGDDLDGDGVVDLVVGAPGANRVYVYLGGFDDPTVLEGVGGDALAWVPDLDGDGLVELAVGDADVGTVRVYGATLAEPVEITGSGGAALAGGDFDGDGVGDLVIGAPEADTVTVCLGPALEPAWSATGGGERLGAAVAALDIDDDGYDEVAAGAPDALNAASLGAVYLFLGGPDGPASSPTWTGVPEPYEVGLGSALAAADMDGDGFEDLAAALSYAEWGYVRLWTSTGSTLSDAHAWSMGGSYLEDEVGPTLGDVGDLDGDGTDDLAYNVVDTDGYTDGCDCPAARYGAVVRGGSGGGYSDTDLLLLSGAGPIAAAGDIDGNGTIDLVFGVPDEGVVVLQLTWPDDDGDDPWGLAAAVEPDCDDTDGAVHLGGVETDVDGIDGDCDGDDDRVASTHVVTCPSFSSLEEARAYAEVGCPAEVCAPDLLDAAWTEAAANALSGDLESGCASAAWAGTTEGTALRAEVVEDTCVASGSEELTWLDIELDGSSGLTGARAWMEREEYATSARGTLRWADGTTAWFDHAHTWTGYEDEWGSRHDGMTATISFGPCAYTSVFEDYEWIGGDQTWTVSDGTHTAVVSDQGCATSPGYFGASFDSGAEVPVDYSTWAPPPGTDGDGDGWPASMDCDDADASVNPCAPEVPDDGVDQDCDGSDLSTADTGSEGDTDEPGETGDADDTEPSDDTDEPEASDETDEPKDTEGCAGSATPTDCAASPTTASMIWLAAAALARRRRE